MIKDPVQRSEARVGAVILVGIAFLLACVITQISQEAFPYFLISFCAFIYCAQFPIVLWSAAYSRFWETQRHQGLAVTAGLLPVVMVVVGLLLAGVIIPQATLQVLFSESGLGTVFSSGERIRVASAMFFPMAGIGWALGYSARLFKIRQRDSGEDRATA